MALRQGTGTALADVANSGIGVRTIKGTGLAEALVETESTSRMSLVGEGSALALVDNTANFRDIPPVATVTPLTSTTMRVDFSEPMTQDAELADPLNYDFTVVDGAIIVCNSATPEAGADPTYVDLVVTEMTEGAAYELTVDPAVTDQDGSSVEEVAGFTGIGLKPQIASVVAQNSTTVRVTFNEPMDPNAGELINAANYTITPGGGAAPVNVNSVSAFGPAPEWVDLLTSEMTEGGSYTCDVDSSGPIRDAARNPLDPGFASAGFTGEGLAPTVLSLVAQSANRIDVIFSEPMKDNADIRNPANYVFDGGLLVLDVLEVDGDTVKLVTTDQNPDQLYTVTIG
jgi:hypothetical protein